MKKEEKDSLMIKKIVSVFLISLVFSASFAQNSASVANRRTAVRYLQLSKQFASEKLWNEASSNAEMGLAYDDSIADLWYLRAVSLMNRGEKKSAVLPLVVTALDSEWVDYNRDGARILYASILCDTREFEKALSVIDSEPFIYSADAEYIRAKSYYCLDEGKGSGPASKARARLDSARRVYPLDSRFAELFYSYEYQILRNTGSVSAETQPLADAFSLSVPLYKNAGDDLEIYAAIFASDQKVGGSESKKVRMLKAFNSKGRKSPLYAIEALKAGLINEDTALDYLYSFADKTISLSILEDFSALLASSESGEVKEVTREFFEYLNSYSGTITIDTDSDLITNMVAVYKRGRPQQISYDKNQDDEYEWKAECDFGVPLRISLLEGKSAVELEYSSWPYISSAKYKSDETPDLLFTLVAETLKWTPLEVVPDGTISKSLENDFFVPVLSDSYDVVSAQDLLNASLSYSLPSKERAGAEIQVSLLNGEAQIARYSVGEKIYAMAQFEKGLPVSRKVDADGDGLFETVEYYGFSADPNESAGFISASDEMQVMTNLFGTPASGTGFYMRKITVDRNGDTIPDFTEEYVPGTVGAKTPGKISSWDTDGDGKWDVQYIKHPSMIDGKLREEAKFHQPFSDSVVTVFSENGSPVSVQSGNEILSVKKGSEKNFYWILASDSQKTSRNDEKKIIKSVTQEAEPGSAIIVETGENPNKKRFLSVRIEKMIFGMEVPDEKLPEIISESQKKEKESKK